MTDPRVLKVTQGFNGWTPKLSVVSDDARRVLKLSGWTGGQGNPPPFELFLGAIGYVTDIADAINIAGEATPVQYQKDGVDVGDPDIDTINFTGDVELSYLSGTLTINVVGGGDVQSVNSVLPDIGGNIELNTGDIPETIDANYVSDAQLVVIGNTSNTNTGDETQSTIKTKLGVASSGIDGYLSGTDWDTFNAKSDLALGETSTTAYRGDRGKTAYDHSQVFAGNPHGTTKADLGLGNVDNTSDADKPISTATQTALNGKEPTLANVITAGTYGSSTQYPIVTYNARGIATGVTLQTVSASDIVLNVVTTNTTVSAVANKNHLIEATSAFTLNADLLSAGYGITIKCATVSSMLVTFTSGIGRTFLGSNGGVITSTTLQLGQSVNLVIVGSGVRVMPSYQIASSNFRLLQNAADATGLSFNLTGLSAVSYTWTAPPANINFGDLSNIATTNSNVRSGTRTHIVGGSSNTVSGTDNILVGGNGNALSTGNVVAINAVGYDPFAFSLVQKTGVILGTSNEPVLMLSDGRSYFNGALGAIQCLQTNARTASGVAQNATFDGTNTVSNTNCVKLLASASALGGATHDVDVIVAVGAGSPITPVRTVFARRRVYVSNNGTMTANVITLDVDFTQGAAATAVVTIDVIADTTNNRLIPSITVVSGAGQTEWQASVRVTSHFNRK